MDKEKKEWAIRTIIIFFLFIFFLILGSCTAGLLSPFPYLDLDSFRGKVIDTETKKPIPGAAILAVYFKKTYGIAGVNSWDVDAQEALTDEKGEFIIPHKKRWLAPRRGYTKGKITIFKPGYGNFPWHQQSKAIGEKYKLSPTPNKYIIYNLPKIQTKEERRKNLPMKPFIKKSKYKLFLKLINEERIYLGLSKIPLKGGIEDVI